MSTLIVFSRFAIGSALIISSLSKVKGFHSFRESIVGFQILPSSLHKIAAFAFIFIELTIAIMILFGGQWLFPGFIAATFLFTIFTTALISVLIRRIQVGCNCFGSTNKPVSRYDIIRNSGFILLGIVGWAGTFTQANRPTNTLEAALLALLALAFVTLWINLREIIEAFQVS